MRTPTITLLLGCLLSGHAAEPLIIHEWGTFTSLQDEQGRTIGGLNVDEEYLPDFVHNLHPLVIGNSRVTPPDRFSKGFSHGSPSVTMRLETPVIYVHLPPGQSEATFDLTATFHGGFLSQFYPMAEPGMNGRALRWQDVTYSHLVQDKPTPYTVRELQVQGPGADGTTTWQPWQVPTLDRTITSSLTWRGIRAGGADAAPKTESPVWLAPRAVNAANLTVGSEHEKYLFYRGLAHLDAPLVTKRSTDGRTLHVSPRLSDLDGTSVPQLWFADLRGDGTAAFHAVKSVNNQLRSTGLPAFSHVPATFTADEYSVEQLTALRQELHAALVTDGLFADEAHALLNTWEASYFKAPGQRLFFLVPQVWTDRVLPLTISTPAVVTRSMMGRIELVSPAQRQAITTIATGPASDTAWYDRFVKEHIGYQPEKIDPQDEPKYVERPNGRAIMQRLYEGDTRVYADLKIDVPRDYQAFFALGRFREALLWDEQLRKPNAQLAKFLRTYVANGWVVAPWQAKAMGMKITESAADDVLLMSNEAILSPTK